jgi:hypothetical protein
MHRGWFASKHHPPGTKRGFSAFYLTEMLMSALGEAAIDIRHLPMRKLRQAER